MSDSITSLTDSLFAFIHSYLLEWWDEPHGLAEIALFSLCVSFILLSIVFLVLGKLCGRVIRPRVRLRAAKARRERERIREMRERMRDSDREVSRRGFVMHMAASGALLGSSSQAVWDPEAGVWISGAGSSLPSPSSLEIPNPIPISMSLSPSSTSCSTEWSDSSSSTNESTSSANSYDGSDSDYELQLQIPPSLSSNRTRVAPPALAVPPMYPNSTPIRTSASPRRHSQDVMVLLPVVHTSAKV